MTEEEIRMMGLCWNTIERAFIWYDLSRDFIRELVEYDKTYKTQLQHHILMAFHGYASYPSHFFSNMYCYLDLKLAEQKELYYYKDQVYRMYLEQQQKEWSSREVYRMVDSTGTVLDQIAF